MPELGIFLIPLSADPATTVAQATAADQAGLDLIGIQDHPYQPRFFDTWTLLSYLAGRTERVRLVPDVTNLPLRLPSVLAKAAASLDVLSGGRVELGIGAANRWDEIAAMGGPRRTPGESVDALEEAIAVLRGFWAGDEAVEVRGEHYTVAGAKPGPAPAHPIGIWVGAYGPRMLGLTGRLADGWLPSIGGDYLSPEDIPPMQARIDEAAKRAGRDPAAIKRVVNVASLEGDPGGWAGQLLRIAELGFDAVLVLVPPGGDPVGLVRRIAEEVAPGVRERAG